MLHASRASRGFTLIEAAVVIAVLALIAGSAVPGLAGLVDAHRLDGAARQLAADVQSARAEAVARNRSLRLSFENRGGASCYVVHTGAAGRCVCSGESAPVCASGAEPIRSASFAVGSRLSVSANVGSMVFDPLHGTVSPTGTLRMSDGRGHFVQHVVNIVGRIRSCGGGLVTAAYPAC